ncbi:hypothetical protein D3C75_1007530 [compost metagenome]
MAGGMNDKTVDAVGLHHSDVVFFLHRIIVRIAYNHAVAIVGAGILCALHHTGGVRVGDIGKNHPDGIAAVLLQSPGHPVGAVTQPGDGFMDSLQGRFRDGFIVAA